MLSFEVHSEFVNKSSFDTLMDDGYSTWGWEFVMRDIIIVTLGRNKENFMW